MKNVDIVTVATHQEGMLNDLIHNNYNAKVHVLGFGQEMDRIYDEV